VGILLAYIELRRGGEKAGRKVGAGKAERGSE